MEDFVIMKTGFNNAVNECLEKLKDLNDYDIIENRLNRIKFKNELMNQYKGTVSKYYDSKNGIGFIVLDDIDELKGVQILIKENKYVEISEKDLIFAIKNTDLIWSEDFAYKDQANGKFNSLVSKFNKI